MKDYLHEYMYMNLEILCALLSLLHTLHTIEHDQCMFTYVSGSCLNVEIRSLELTQSADADNGHGL